MNHSPSRPRPRGKPQDGHLSGERLAFCEGLLAGKSHQVAYEESGFRARGKNAATNARQLLHEPETQAYLAARRMELRARADGVGFELTFVDDDSQSLLAALNSLVEDLPPIT